MADIISGGLAATKQDLIAALVQRELAFNAKLLPYFTDVSAYAVAGSKSISFPKLTSFTVINRTEAVQGDASALSSSTDQLLLDKNLYVAWILDSMTKAQSNIQAEMEFAKRAAASMSRYIDSLVIGVLGTAAASFQNVGADVDVTYSDLVDMQEAYLNAEGLIDQGAWFFSVQQNKALISLTEFKDVSAFGEMVIRDGYVKQLLGMPVVIHTGLAGKEAYLAGKESIAVGFQKSPAMDEQNANEFGVGAMRVAMDCLMGLKALQTGEKGAAAGKSPLILGLND